MDRRNFFSFMTVFPVVFGAAAVKQSQAGETPLKTTLTMIGLKKESKPKKYGFNFADANEADTVEVSLAPGRDGNLWIKTGDDDWKRIVTE